MEKLPAPRDVVREAVARFAEREAADEHCTKRKDWVEERGRSVQYTVDCVEADVSVGGACCAVVQLSLRGRARFGRSSTRSEGRRRRRGGDPLRTSLTPPAHNQLVGRHRFPAQSPTIMAASKLLAAAMAVAAVALPSVCEFV